LLKAAESPALATQGITAPPLVVVGPTASGKTELALALARRLGGEVVSVDSRQIYKRLDAGTAKPIGAWRADRPGYVYVVEGIPHHLLDFLEPTETFDAARFVSMASEAIEGIQKRGRVPVLAGGSGMYLQALFTGLDPQPPRSPEVRAALERELAAKGAAALLARLKAADPAAADWAGLNPRRLTRALEVIETSGKKLSEQWTGKFLKDLPEGAGLYFALDPGRDELDRRIELRSRTMWPAMIEEAKRLMSEGLDRRSPGLGVLGYPDAAAAALGEVGLEEGRERLVRATRRYAKRQRTWFRRYKRLRWVAPEPGLDEKLASLYREFIGGPRT
jgi:tRNA dimethylallyltransferase